MRHLLLALFLLWGGDAYAQSCPGGSLGSVIDGVCVVRVGQTGNNCPSGTACHYANLTAAETGEQADLSVATGTGTPMEIWIYNKGGAYGERVLVDGWTTDSTGTLTWMGADSERTAENTTGYSTDRAWQEYSGDYRMWLNKESYMTIKNFQVLCTYPGASCR